MDYLKNNKIAVIDFGGQYAHLIASRIRRLGAYAEIVSPDQFTAEAAVHHYSGIIYSGGPSSVYEPGAPHSDPALLETGMPLLGICYGHHMICQQMGGEVSHAEGREYGEANLRITEAKGIFEGEAGENAVVWMSHGDEVTRLPEGFTILASTEDCRYTAVGDPARNIYGLQFHPEVTHSVHGDRYLSNFIRICGLENSYTLDNFLENEIRNIREAVHQKKVFLLISGGVDSTVAFALLSRALPHDHLLGLCIDTGFMRGGEIEEVSDALRTLGVNLHVHDASDLFYEKLDGVFDPERKRNIIGELFLDVRELVCDRLKLNLDEWFLGQGTIYPDTIESGATKNSHKIKTHHNRIDRIQKMIDQGLVIEPIRDLYKDEVRRLGLMLGLPEKLVMRHPFPGPGLAVRCLCAASEPSVEAFPEQPLPDQVTELLSANELELSVLPVQSVGVQGDQRSYAHPAALFHPAGCHPAYEALFGLGRLIPNRIAGINRVLYCIEQREATARRGRLKPQAGLSRERIGRLQKADGLVTEFLRRTGLYDSIWQFPVVLAPVTMDGDPTGDESIILRPVESTDAMTASCPQIPFELLETLARSILSAVGCSAVFLDITSKPPGTIEWE